MNFSDEQLSAFFDSELPEADMQAIRDAIANDETLVDRIAMLAEPDAVIAATYRSIDEKPLPQGILETLASAPSNNTETSKVVTLPAPKRWLKAIMRPSALVASVVLTLGIGIGALMFSNPSDPSWESIANVLENSPSGTAQVVGDTTVIPALTFTNRQNQYCRLYTQTHDGLTQDSIACRQAGDWELAASAYRNSATTQGDLYQPASSAGSPLDHFLDQMISSGPYDATDESRLLNQGWQ